MKKLLVLLSGLLLISTVNAEPKPVFSVDKMGSVVAPLAYQFPRDPTQVETSPIVIDDFWLNTVTNDWWVNIDATPSMLSWRKVSFASSRAISTPTFASVTTAAQLSTTRDAQVAYYLNANLNITLLAGQSITMTLQYADNSAMSTNVVTIGTITQANSGVLGLATINPFTSSGVIPSGKYRKLTITSTGNPTLPTTLTGQEVLL